MFIMHTPSNKVLPKRSLHALWFDSTLTLSPKWLFFQPNVDYMEQRPYFEHKTFSYLQ